MVNVFVNGRYVGEHEKANQLIASIKDLRKEGKLPNSVSICHYSDLDEIQINTDSGRIRRPLIIVKDGKSLATPEIFEKLRSCQMTFPELLRKGVIELVDAEEEENAFIALNEGEIISEHTHVEIHPETIFGISAGIIPFMEHNQASRDNLGSNMSKQSLGIYAANFHHRTDTQRHLMHYPQIPMATTEISESVNAWRRPAGQNMVVAILSYQGYNMQDALILNKSSCDRGLARTSFYRTYSSEKIRYAGGQEDEIGIPTEDVSGFKTEKAYRFLDEDGIVTPECEIAAGDVLIGKTSPPRFLESLEEFGAAVTKRRESSAAVKHGEKGIVDLVVLTETQDGNKQVKVKLRDLRIPELGDKFASRHGQKGTIGLLVNAQDMPFTESGIIPDIIINPHAIPSRMTVAQLLETVGGKMGAMEGRQADGTVFTGEKEMDMRKTLETYGFKNNGKEVMYDGITGEKYEVDIFIGIVYYQKLKHMVADKIRARSRGPVQVLTRQPTEGKAREGGLRVGEMEKDCLVAHGTAMLLRERLLEESDKTKVPICLSCGMTAIYDRYRDIKYCPLCGEDTNVQQVEMSYAFKLLLDELKSMCTYPRLKIGD
ncbi:DNA-directed RNA polymerase subunit B [Candidatus Undinarchaeota archaeon]